MKELERLRRWLLVEHAGTIDADRLAVVADRLVEVVNAGTEGVVVELGCFRGAMALWMRAVLDTLGDGRHIHVYDSFQGLPARGPHDSDYLDGVPLVAAAKEVIVLHEQWGRAAPVIHPGWFSDSLPGGLPDVIAFAYLDGDFYSSILTSLVHCVPRLSPGAVLIVDDYADTDLNPRAWDGLPGVKRACDEFFGRPSPIEVVAGEGDLAFGLYRRERVGRP